MKFNLHTHKYRCKHAKGKDEDYVVRAIETNMEVLGFSDHIPFKHDHSSKIRMQYEEMDEYFNSIHSLKQKYHDQIQIYVGFESEYIEQDLTQKKNNYLIGWNYD